jgi:hypothetical protein
MRVCAVLLEVSASFLVIFVQLWNKELLEHVQIHDTDDCRIHEEEEALHSFFAEGAKQDYIWAVANMCQGDTWVFAAPDPAGIGIDLTADMKRALITDNYGVKKSLLQYQWKSH